MHSFPPPMYIHIAYVPQKCMYLTSYQLKSYNTINCVTNTFMRSNNHYDNIFTVIHILLVSNDSPITAHKLDTYTLSNLVHTYLECALNCVSIVCLQRRRPTILCGRAAVAVQTCTQDNLGMRVVHEPLIG